MNTVDNISYADSLLNILPDGIVILTFDERVLQVNLQAKTGLHINISSDSYEKDLYAGELFELIYRDKNILTSALDVIRQGKEELILPPNTSIREKSTNTIFPVKGRFCRLPFDEGVEVIIFYFRNITSELTQEYILNTALNRTRIYPWFFDLDRQIFSLDARYFEYLGIIRMTKNSCSMISLFSSVVIPYTKSLSRSVYCVETEDGSGLKGNPLTSENCPACLIVWSVSV